MNDIVKSELVSIQNKYLALLKEVKHKIKTNWAAVIDEINLFWLQKKRFITFIIENYFTPYNTFIFTAATFLDYDDKEHFPFVACGNLGIIDDTICSYGNIIGNIDDKKFSNTIKSQLMLQIDDNIKILENCSQYFYILPIRFLLTEDNDSVAIGAESAFLSLFNVHFENMNEYFQNIITFEDLERCLDNDCKKHIMFHQEDNVNLSLRERVDNYIEYTGKNMNFDSQPMSYIFMSAIYSNIAQALDVILLCTKYKLIPYLRYNVAFFYFSHLIQDPNIAKIDYMDDIRIKANACYVIYRVFDKKSLEYSEFNSFAILAHERNLFEKVLDKVKQHGINLSLNQITEYARAEIQAIVNDLHK